MPRSCVRANARVMARLNLTLDADTADALERHARRQKRPTASLARELLREALDRRDALDRQRRLARDYVAGRADARLALADLEAAQLDLLDEP